MKAEVVAKQFSDQWWRINNLYWIVDKAGKRVRFTPNSSQEALYRNMWYRNVILKARQRGFTTFLCIYALDSCLFNRDYAAGIVSHNLEDSKKIFRTKIKFPYDSLPEGIRQTIRADNDRAGEYVFSNGSSISVSTSYRSGTLQFLHVSEYGKIAAKNPERAIEIKTGAFEAVPRDGVIVVESTAEGSGGDFYDMVGKARKLAEKGSELTRMDYRFIFEPWWANPEYSLDEDILITEEHHRYFDALADNGIELTEDQKRWYVGKLEVLGDKMRREYPSTPDEAFETSIEGAYYANEMRVMRGEGRICKIPIEKALDVHTFWDLGRNDANAIWFMQHVGKEYRFIDYYEASGEGLVHYAEVLKQRAQKYGWTYGKHYLPHDVEVTELSRDDNKSRKQILEGHGVKPIVTVKRVPDINEGIQMVRGMMPYVWIDEQRCSRGINCLDSYQHEWDERNAVFRNRPLHNWASNGADAFRQFAQGYRAVNKDFMKELEYDFRGYI